jgi:hypothetical protein
MSTLDKRLRDLERKAEPGKIVVCWMKEGSRYKLTPEEEAAKLAAARQEAGPNGTVVIVTRTRNPSATL